MTAPTALRRAGPCAFVVFGAMGDLTKRKLLPALYNLAVNGLLPREFAFIGVARKNLDDESYREYAAAALRDCATVQPVDERLLSDITSRTRYVQGDF
jgi:glucose-6-phosphate 1-dehydrogenase